MVDLQVIDDVDFDFQPPLKGAALAMAEAKEILTAFGIPWNLADKLRAEWPAILAWFLEGCLEWQHQGLNAPKVVVDATAQYFEAEDAVGQWLADICEIRADYETPSVVLFRSWKAWAEDSHEGVGNRREFCEALEMRHFPRTRIGHDKTRGHRGLRVVPEFERCEPTPYLNFSVADLTMK